MILPQLLLGCDKKQFHTRLFSYDGNREIYKTNYIVNLRHLNTVEVISEKEAGLDVDC